MRTCEVLHYNRFIGKRHNNRTTCSLVVGHDRIRQGFLCKNHGHTGVRLVKYEDLIRIVRYVER